MMKIFNEIVKSNRTDTTISHNIRNCKYEYLHIIIVDNHSETARFNDFELFMDILNSIKYIFFNF